MMRHCRGPYKRHTRVREAQGVVMSQYEHTCMIRGDGGQTLRAILDQICNKWTLLIVATLDRRTVRFTELQQQIPGISQRMLTLTLRNLERDGLVARAVHAEVPPRVEYSLTPAGRSLLPPALALAGWAMEHVPDIEASRTAYESTRSP
jgi:DNA-binding HxlR family transcriptional regulator